MSKSNTWESDLLKLVFNNTTASLIGDATGLVGSATAGVVYVSLHTADPTEGGSQTSSEATYTGYTRISVARTAGGWSISGTTPTAASNVSTVTFPICTGGSNTISHVGIGTDFSGTGKLLYSGALGSTLAVSNNITPSFAPGAIVITED
jgi:hypothetical protein